MGGTYSTATMASSWETSTLADTFDDVLTIIRRGFCGCQRSARVRSPRTGTGMERTRWIVVGMDFSDGSIRALDFAMEYARVVGANVVCVHAYEDAPGTPAFHDPAQAIGEQLEEVIALRRPSSSSLRVDPIVRRGAPWEKLANVA